MKKTKYVVGFAFSRDLSQVALVKKIRPNWQKGLLNGIGGHIDGKETALEAMTREFEEEAGVNLLSWARYAKIQGDAFEVQFFCTRTDLSKLETKTDEKVVIHDVSLISGNINDYVHGVPALVLSAIDYFKGSPTVFTTLDC